MRNNSISAAVAGGQDLRAGIFYSGAIERIERCNVVCGAISVVVAWIWLGVAWGIGAFLGSLVSWLSFYWLARTVRSLADRIVESHKTERGGGVVLRFVLRYFFVGSVAYVTLTSYPNMGRGLLVGLCLPVVGLMIEAVYETFMSFRYGL